MKRSLVLLAILPLFASAAEVNITWTHPTQYTDSSPLVLDNIKETLVQYGTCTTATTPTFSLMTAEKVVPGPANTVQFTAVVPGTICVRARTVDLQSRLSNWSTTVSKVIVEIKPRPPTGITFN